MRSEMKKSELNELNDLWETDVNEFNSEQTETGFDRDMFLFFKNVGINFIWDMKAIKGEF